MSKHGVEMIDVKVIAEAATCHGGCAAKAHELVDAAADAGADVVKFQLIHPHRLYAPFVTASDGRQPNPVIAQRESEQLPLDVWREVADHCREREVEFALTLFDVDSLALVSELDLPFVKIASGDLTYTPLLERVGEFSVPVLLSTGMSTMGEIEKAIDALTRFGSPAVTLLHCVSIYPCPPDLANLGRMTALKSFGLSIGFSDHTLGSAVAAAAVALGATAVEKHMRLADGPVTADFEHSLDERALMRFVSDLRAVQAALRGVSLKVSADEKLVMQRARRGGYAARDLPAGSVLSQDDVVWLRPMTAPTPGGVEGLIGRTLRNSLSAGDSIHPDSLV